MTDPIRDGGQAAVAVLGVTLAAVHVRHVLLMSDPLLVVVEAAVPLGLALGLVASAGWLRREGYTRRETGYVLAWIGVGVFAMLCALLWTIGHELFAGAEMAHLPYLLANNVTGGAVVGVVLGSYDVATRRRERAYEEARTEAQRERDRFATLFEGVPSPTVHYEYVDGEPLIRDANPAFVEVFGFSEEEALGRSVDDLIVPPDRQDEAAALNERLDERDLQVEVQRRAADGTRDFLLYTVPLSETSDHGFATYVDITEQKRREQRLQVLNRVLRHDHRNAMNVVMGHAADIVEASDDPSVRACAEAILSRSEDLLERSRKARSVERALGEETRERKAVDVAALVRRRAAAASIDGIDITVAVPADPVWVAGNDLLDVAVDNLLENAVKHAEDPAVEVRVTPGNPVQVTVRDDGPGIPEEELAVLERDRETQLHHTSGLGLWLVTWIVRDVDGDVSFRSLEDGTEVTLSLEPADPPGENESEEDGGEARGTAYSDAS
ncbi:ATP-binding protein [Haloparvum sedimenti]|uniref:ATP-binding protein n=1 Tax=Haloparvum sedimenti TaxID=1678448 RepID=UPI00071E7CCC|nr:PAS domain-containing sensor histidine kinase [Haloparvum sedimenti]